MLVIFDKREKEPKSWAFSLCWANSADFLKVSLLTDELVARHLRLEMKEVKGEKNKLRRSAWIGLCVWGKDTHKITCRTRQKKRGITQIQSSESWTLRIFSPFWLWKVLSVLEKYNPGCPWYFSRWLRWKDCKNGHPRHFYEAPQWIRIDGDFFIAH